MLFLLFPFRARFKHLSWQFPRFFSSSRSLAATILSRRGFPGKARHEAAQREKMILRREKAAAWLDKWDWK